MTQPSFPLSKYLEQVRHSLETPDKIPTVSSNNNFSALEHKLLSSIAELNRTLSALPNFNELIEGIINHACELLHAEMGGILLYDDETNKLVLQRPGFKLHDEDAVSFYQVGLNEDSNAIKVFLSGKPYLSNDALEDPRLMQKFLRFYGGRNAITVPLTVADKRIGVFHLANKIQGRFDLQDVAVLQLLCEHFVALLQNARAQEVRKKHIQKLEEFNNLVAAQNQNLQQVIAIHNLLLEKTLSGTNLQILVEVLESNLSSTVLVKNLEGDILASCLPEFSEISKGNIEKLFYQHDFKRYLNKVRLNKRALALDLAEQLPGWFALIAPIVVNRETTGFIYLTRPERPYSSFDIITVEQTAMLLALDLQKEQLILDRERQAKNSLLLNLVLNPNLEEKEFLRHASLLGYDFRKSHSVGIITVHPPVPSAEGSARFLDLINKELHKWLPQIASTIQNDYLIILVPEFVKGLKELHSIVTRNVQQFVPGLTWSMGLGKLCAAPGDYNASFQQAQKALETGQRLNLQTEIYFFEALQKDILLSNADPELAAAFVRSALGALQEYDSKHQSDLVSTLDALFQGGNNLARTAACLHIHINTLRYRLERIQELVKVDLQEAETRFELQLALRLLKLMAPSELC